MAISRAIITGEDTKSTTDNSWQQIFAITLNPDSSGWLTYNIVGTRLSDGATKTWALRIGFKKVGSANPVVSAELLGDILGTTTDKLNLILADATIAVDADNLLFKVKGLNSSNMSWYARADGWVMEQS